jgi:hypothetical protein
MTWWNKTKKWNNLISLLESLSPCSSFDLGNSNSLSSRGSRAIVQKQPSIAGRIVDMRNEVHSKHKHPRRTWFNTSTLSGHAPLTPGDFASLGAFHLYVQGTLSSITFRLCIRYVVINLRFCHLTSCSQPPRVCTSGHVW